MERMRWQYAVVNVGTFNTQGRLVLVLGSLGAEGWELVHVYDKASNWLAGTEKGFALFKRAVAEGDSPPEGWAVALDPNDFPDVSISEYTGRPKNAAGW
jgi:hypothetical protein